MNTERLHDPMAQAEHSVESTGRKKRSWKRFVVMAALSLCLGGAVYGYQRYRILPLEDLPVVDLSLAHPAVQQAIEEARQAVTAAPRSGAAWGALGLILRAHEFDRDANTCLVQAMKFDPRNALWPYVRGSSLSVRNRPESVRCFLEAARLRPDMALPRLRAAELYLEERRLDDADAEYLAALEIEPENARALLGLGLIALARGNAEEARRWGEKSWAHDPEQRTTAELLLRVFRRLGDDAAAARQQALLDKMPPGEVGWDDPYGEKVMLLRRDPGGLAAAAQDLLTRGRLPDAVNVLERLVVAAPETSQYSVVLAKSLIRQGNLGRARQILDAALIRHQESADLHFQSGVAFYLAGKWESALAAFHRAIELKPDFSDAHYNLGHTCQQLHDPRGAIAAFREAVRFRPDYTAAYINLGVLLEEAGERDAARDALETANRLAPDDPQPRRLLKQLQ